MKLFRLLGAAGVAALVLLAVPGAGPALATNEVAISSPSDTAYNAYPALSGTVTQSGSGGVVTKVELALTSVDGLTSENATLTYNNGASNSSAFSGGGATVNFSWVPKPKYNGRYTLTVNGTGTYNKGFGGTQQETSGGSRSFNLEIDPAKPTGVAAGFVSEDSEQVAVTWSPNPEPDLAYYQVLRSYAGGSAAPVGATVAPSSKPTFHDDLTGKAQGQYKYSVQAFRKARTCTSSDEACTRKLPGPVSSQSQAVTVRATPATTTTTSTTIKKGGGGSTGGGSTSTTVKGGSSGGSTGTTVKGGPTSGGGRSVRNPGAAPGGNVDLSQFGALLGGNGKTSKTGGGAIDEGTYDPELKYQTGEQPVQSSKDDNSLITIGGTSLPKPSDDWVRFAGAGSLATALLVHVLWFKQQVDSIPLEAIND